MEYRRLKSAYAAMVYLYKKKPEEYKITRNPYCIVLQQKVFNCEYADKWVEVATINTLRSKYD